MRGARIQREPSIRTCANDNAAFAMSYGTIIISQKLTSAEGHRKAAGAVTFTPYASCAARGSAALLILRLIGPGWAESAPGWAGFRAMADLAARRCASCVFGVTSRCAQGARLAARAAGASVDCGAASYPDVQQYGMADIRRRNRRPHPKLTRIPGCIWRPASPNIGRWRIAFIRRRRISALRWPTGEAMVGERLNTRRRAPPRRGRARAVGRGLMPCGPPISRVAISQWGPTHLLAAGAAARSSDRLVGLVRGSPIRSKGGRRDSKIPCPVLRYIAARGILFGRVCPAWRQWAICSSRVGWRMALQRFARRCDIPGQSAGVSRRPLTGQALGDSMRPSAIGYL